MAPSTIWSGGSWQKGAGGGWSQKENCWPGWWDAGKPWTRRLPSMMKWRWDSPSASPRDELIDDLWKAARLVARRAAAQQNAEERVIDISAQLQKLQRSVAAAVTDAASRSTATDEARAQHAKVEERVAERRGGTARLGTCTPDAELLAACTIRLSESADPSLSEFLGQVANALRLKAGMAPQASQGPGAGPTQTQASDDMGVQIAELARDGEALIEALAAAARLPEPEAMAAFHEAMQRYLPQACPLVAQAGGKAAGKGKAAVSTTRAEAYLTTPS